MACLGSIPLWIIWNLEDTAILGAYVMWSKTASSTSISWTMDGIEFISPEHGLNV
jgi:hypothetical protein